MDELYREVLLEHYKNPVNKGKMISSDIHKEDSNPLCGDIVEIAIRLDAKEKIKDVKFEGKGCVICMASADMLAEELKGKTLKQVQEMTREDMTDLIGIKLDHVRIKCAMLPLVATKKGILEFEAKR